MRKILLMLLVLALATPAWSATLTAEWTPQTSMSTTVDGTRIYQDTSTTGPVASVVGVSANKADFPMPGDGKCHNYWATNHKGAIESPKSDVVVWCPPNPEPPPAVQPPVIMGGFKITTKVEPIQ